MSFEYQACDSQTDVIVWLNAHPTIEVISITHDPNRDKYEIFYKENVDDHPQNDIKEELDLITQWFKQIAQIADDRKTLNGYVMEDWAALDEIRALAKNSAEFIKSHLK